MQMCLSLRFHGSFQSTLQVHGEAEGQRPPRLQEWAEVRPQLSRVHSIVRGLEYSDLSL